MNLFKKSFWVFLIFGALFFGAIFAKAETVERYPARLYLFYLDTCPHCHEELKFLDKIKGDYPNLEVVKFEVSKDFKNQNLFQQVNDKFSLQGGVPVTVIGDQHFLGFDNEKGLGTEIKKLLDNCSTKKCDSFLDGLTGKGSIEKMISYELNGGSATTEKEPKVQTREAGKKYVQVFGRDICINDAKSVCFLGVFLGLADGINPCMFSVLIFLLTYLLAVGSKKRAIKAGVAFILTTFVLYFLFMLGIIKMVELLGIAVSVRKVITFLAFLLGLIMIKDYFFYGRWVALEIPTRFKPYLEKLTHRGTIVSAALLALASGLVELPCTSGLPLAFISVLSDKGLAPLWYLTIYNFFFILPLIIIVFGVTLFWQKADKIESWRQNWKKYMRLITGLLLIFLALAMWNNWL